MGLDLILKHRFIIIMKQLIALVILSTLLIFYQNCSEFEASTSGSLNSINNFSYINDNIISLQCASCHSVPSPQGGVDLSDYDAILASGTVITGNAEASTLYTEVLSGDMPPNGEAVSPLDVQAIASWINAGALENEIPQVDAGADRNVILPVNSVQIAATASDIDGEISAYLWEQVSGPNTAVLADENTSRLTASSLIIGNYVFAVTVTDDFGDTATDSVSVNVSDAPNTPPSVSLGADVNLTLPTDNTSLVASASDSDGSIASFAWVQDAGPNTATLSGQTTATLSISNLIEGTYTFTVTVTDDDGATANDSINVVVAAAAPTFTELNNSIFSTQCLNCHGNVNPRAGYNMSTYAGVITRVTAGNAAVSPLHLRTADGTMPVGSPMPAIDVNRIRDWINAGALDN